MKRSNRGACPAAWKLLEHFVSRGAMEVDGLGERQVPRLSGAGSSSTAATSAGSAPEQLRELDGFGEGRRPPPSSPRSSASQGAARWASALRPWPRGGRLRHWAEPGGALPGVDARPGRHAGADRSDAGTAPIVAALIHEQLPTHDAALIDDLRTLGLTWRRRARRRGRARSRDARSRRRGPCRSSRASRPPSGSPPAVRRDPFGLEETDYVVAGDIARGRSSRRPSGSASPVVDEAGLLALLDGGGAPERGDGAGPPRPAALRRQARVCAGDDPRVVRSA